MVALNQNDRRRVCERILAVLCSSECVDPESLTVESAGDSIRIEGIAYSVSRKATAFKMAVEVAAGEHVINELSVAPTSSNHSEINPGDSIIQLIHDELDAEATLESCELVVSVIGGKCRLNGYVHTSQQKTLVEQIVKCQGIGAIENQIVVRRDEFGDV